MKGWLQDCCAHTLVGISLMVITLGCWLVSRSYAQEVRIDVQQTQYEAIEKRLISIEGKVNKILQKP